MPLSEACYDARPKASDGYGWRLFLKCLAYPAGGLACIAIVWLFVVLLPVHLVDIVMDLPLFIPRLLHQHVEFIPFGPPRQNGGNSSDSGATRQAPAGI